MDKLYFTAYILEKGRIKKGDTYFYEGEDTYFYKKCETDEEEERCNSGKLLGTCELVKLFLCSRDIQVGDEFFIEKISPMENGTEIDISKSHICTKRSQSEDGSMQTVWCKTDGTRDKLYYTSKSNCYKIVGEIAPTTIWAKENMEFTKDEVKFVHRSKLKDISSVRLWEIENVHGPMRKDFYVVVKCPNCNQFH